MRRQPLLVFLALLLLIPQFAHAQVWSGIIDPSRAIDWSNVGIPGGVPSPTTICATLTSSATFTQINNAIATCPAGHVVFLSAGAYNLGGGIIFNGKNNVTLRGAGPTQTLLKFTAGNSCHGLSADICVTNSTGYYYGSSQTQPGGSNAATWSNGYLQGTTQISLTGVGSAGLSVGSVIILDQANDTSDTNGYFVCDVSGLCHQSGESASFNGRTIGGVDYNQTQVVTVTAISGSTYTISPGLYATNWRSSQAPKAWWLGPMITGVGIENLTVDNSGSGSSITSGIAFLGAYQCWIKNVRSYQSNRNHVWLYEGAHNVIRDSYFYGTLNAAQLSYGIEGTITSDDLIENNIFDHIAAPNMLSGISGAVLAYNYSTTNFVRGSSFMAASTWSHDAGNEYNLFEGNQYNGLTCDDFHGTGSTATYFRNQLTGWESGMTQNTVPVELYSNCRAYNIVGNVLGTIGYHNTYEASPQVGSANCDKVIYELGYPFSECGANGTPPPNNDYLVRSTLLRWGNYDTVHAAIGWNSSEVPTAGVPFINGNPVPSSHALPSSLYLFSNPSWWGPMPWPPIGPDVTGGTGPGGFAYANPAHVCFNNTPVDPNYGSNNVLAFDANNCYGQRPAPAPPTSLGVIVH